VEDADETEPVALSHGYTHTGKIVAAVIAFVVLVSLVLMAGDTAGAWALEPTFSSPPCVLHVGGRDYEDSAVCGTGGRAQCWSPHYLRSIHTWPPGDRRFVISFRGVGTVYVPRSYPDASPTIVFVPRGSCYLPYSLEGGP
jgi:hypothetical protein